MKCVFDGHCEININNRHICSYCRLAKCFRSGMQIEMIRSSQSKSNKTSGKRKEMTDDSVEINPSTLVRSNKLEQVKLFSR